jgi:hypothetical protein
MKQSCRRLTTTPPSPLPKMSEESTEAKGDYEAVRFNPMKHGILSRLTMHEGSGEFADLLPPLEQGASTGRHKSCEKDFGLIG